MSTLCRHEHILLDVSEYGHQVGFKQTRHEDACAPSTYPAPLVLPGDALTDPEEREPQTYDDFVNDLDRNEVTAERNTIYLVPPPAIASSVVCMQDWTKPANSKRHGPLVSPDDLHAQVKDYVAAFYHGMPVKLYTGTVKFTRQEGDRSKTPSKIDCIFGDGMLLDIRTRACPDKHFARQLNLNDLLDVLLHALPEDAYAMMLLVNHDIYEEDEDLFQCGRAYGASRVAVVSTARYNPALDKTIGLELEHAWPASHCRQCVKDFTAAHEDEYPAQKKRKQIRRSKARSDPQVGAIQSAVRTYREILGQSDTATERFVRGLWLSRVCRTVTHELGHCLGIDHCTYFACLMQATSGLLEDGRQPLYVCPVDEGKLIRAIGDIAGGRDAAMSTLLLGSEWKDDPTFAAFHAWLART